MTHAYTEDQLVEQPANAAATLTPALSQRERELAMEEVLGLEKALGRETKGEKMNVGEDTGYTAGILPAIRKIML